MHKREFHPPHIYLDTACYFITAGTRHREPFLSTAGKRSLLRDILKQAIIEHRIRLYAWVILSDHYHLLLETKGASPIYKFIKRLHGESAIHLNRVDGTPGRKVWYQYWDRFPRSEAEFWAYFCYIHINPLKHGYVPFPDGVLRVRDELITIATERAHELHPSLAQYPHSSYHYYVREHGEEFLVNAWVDCPFPEQLEHDDF